jgi:hypothetical protein
VQHAFVAVEATERADLERLAAALGGDRAQERVPYGDMVEISGRFGNGDDEYGGVRVYGQMNISHQGVHFLASGVVHDVRLNAQAGPSGRWAHWARCSCGWSHRGSYATRAEAQTVADEHTAAVTR